MATSVKELDLSSDRLQEIVTISKDWALCNGISIRCGAEGKEAEKVSIAPFTLFPSVIPGPVLRQAKSTMVHFSRLMHKVAMDHQFLEQCLKTVIEVDSFMLNLWNIYLKVRESGVKQPLHLGLFRNDFMMNCLDNDSAGQVVSADRLELKQIEFNTIAASFAGMTQQLGHLHRLTLGMAGKSFKPEQMPDNTPALGLAGGMVKAWELYGKPKAVVIFLVGAEERNVMDQRLIEFNIYKQNPEIRVLRKTFEDIHKEGKLDAQSRLLMNGDEVAVIYMRHGYTAENYVSQQDWDARLTCELSQAMKCPSIQYQLVGAKKIQQELCRPGTLERYIPDAKVVAQIRGTFAGQYTLDLTEEGDAAVKLALKSPGKFVLKPQREGGGHNMYGDDIINFFSQHGQSKERSAHILMERIFPWRQNNFLVKSGMPFELSDVVGELGVYGVYIGSADSEEVNYECGHMMRTKTTGTDEGGVVAGFSCLDTPILTD